MEPFRNLSDSDGSLVTVFDRDCVTVIDRDNSFRVIINGLFLHEAAQ
jgi:hypothetical protein